MLRRESRGHTRNGLPGCRLFDFPPEFRCDKSAIDIKLLEDEVHHAFLSWHFWVREKVPPEGNPVLVGSNDVSYSRILHRRMAAITHLAPTVPRSRPDSSDSRYRRTCAGAKGANSPARTSAQYPRWMLNR